MFKRVLSVLMSLVLIVCLLPVGALSVAAEEYGQIWEDCPITVWINEYGEEAILYFTPDISGEYVFYSFNNYGVDTYASIVDAEGDEINWDDDSGGDMNFRVTHYMYAGELYQLRARFYGYEITGSFDVMVTRNYSGSDNPDYPDPDYPYYPDPDYPGELMPGPLEYNDCTYEFDGCSMRLMGYHGWEEEVWIPDQVYGYPVNCIAGYAFAYNSAIRSVYYSGDSLYIEEGAFTECYNLERVELSVWMDCNIGRSAFEGCTSLHDIRMDGCYYSIEGRAFARCESLGWVILPENMHHLGGEVFESCRMLSDVTLSNSMYEIPYAMFLGCESLQEIRIPQSVNFIGMSAFASCGSLSTVYYDGSYMDRQAMMIEEDNQALLDAYWVYSNCEHIFDNACDPTCNLCGEERYVSGHEYDNACDSVCDHCGEEREVTHQYDNRCDTTCNVCGAVRVAGHTYANDCDPTCEWCGAVREIDHEYESPCDTLCDRCGQELVAKHVFDSTGDTTCNECGFVREVAPEDVFTYTIFRDQVHITGYLGEGGDVVIPSTLAEYPVVAIGVEAFRSCERLTSVTVSDGVTRIGGSAFLGCENLREVRLPDSVTDIEALAFCKCCSLTSFTIPPKVTVLNEQVFSSCSGLTELVIPSTVKEIGQHAFWGCTGLTKVTISQGVESIGMGAFRECTGLVSVTIEEGVTGIGASAFCDCIVLSSIELPKSVKNVYPGAFSGCSALSDVYYAGTKAERAQIEIGAVNDPLVNATWHYVECAHTYDSDADDTCNNCGEKREVAPEALFTYFISEGKAFIKGYLGEGGAVEIPSTLDGYSVLGIGAYAFEYCSSITSVSVPDSVTRIGYRAFGGCDGLITATLPNSVTTDIGQSVFSDCTALKTVVLSDGMKKIPPNTFANCRSLVSVTMPSNVVYIHDYAFFGCEKLASIDLPASVTTIGKSAFAGCGTLTEIELPPQLTCIAENAFEACAGLTSVVIPDGVTEIKSDAFSCCAALVSVTLPKSVVSIGADAFSECYRLIDVWYDGTQKDRAAMEIAADYNGPLVSATWHYAECEHEYTDACDTTCMWCEAERTPPHTYDSNVDAICNGCGAVREIPPETLYTYEVVDGKAIITGYLGEGGAIEIPATIGGYNVAAIGDGAFRGVTTLTGVVVPNGVTSIYSYAFSGCYNLASVRLPESVLSIDTGAFEFCESLTTFTFPSGVVSIAEGLFHACYRLETVTLPDGATKIGDGAFVLCTSLKSIDLPNSLEVIGNGAFNYCESLESIVVPYQVWSIGDFAFDSCYGLQSVNLPVCLSYLGENAFAACSSLQSVSLLGTSVRVLRAYTFQYCTALTAVSIPAHTYSIDETAFLGCDGFVIRGFSESYAETFAAAHGIPFELVRQAQFTVGTIKGAVGTSVKVPVYVDGNPGISGVTLNITYDRGALTYTGYEYGDYYGFMHCDGTTFGWVSDSGDVKRDGVLVYLLFDVKSTASLWTNSKISISFDEQDVHNEAQQPVTFGAVDGVVQIVEFTHMELVAPTKTTYYKGDRTLDLSGGKVLLYRADGTVEELELTQSMVYGFDPDEMGTQAVEVSYRGCSASFYVEIVAPSVTGVAWESKPNRVQYVEGGTLDVTGGVLKVTYSDGSTETVNVTERMVSGFDGAVVGTQTLAVKYREFTLEYTVTVVAKSVTSIALTTLPNVREYVVGKDKLTVAGGKLTVYYNNGTSEVINLSTSMVSGFDNTVVGEQTLTVTYNGFTATYTVTVIENNAPTFVVDTVKGRAGNTVTVAVRVKNNPGIVSMKLKIGYDTSVLSLVSAQLQDYTTGASGTGPLVANPFIVNWANTLTGNNTTDGVVINLTFRIADDAVLGETAITVTYDEDDVYDENYDNVFFRTESGAVDVVAYTPGDVNDDGVINNKDLGILFQYLNFWDVEVVSLACDVNRDGAVNNKDLGLLMRYLNGWNVELK